MSRIPLWVIPMLIIEYMENDLYVDKAHLICYSGGSMVYEITTETNKIHKPAEGYNKGDKWEIDTDNGKITLTADCIYKSLTL